MALTKIHKLILQSAGLGAVGPATGASCSIFIAGTGTLAQTYSDRNGATLTANPVIVGADGYVSVYVKSGSYDMTVVSGASTTSVADILAVDDIIISGPQGEPQFATVAAMIAGTPLNQKPGSFNWSNYVGRTVKTVVNNSTSNAGGAEYLITTTNPGSLSTLVGGIWVGPNHSLGGGYYAKIVISESKISAESCGAVADWNRTSRTGTDATLAIQRALDYAALFVVSVSGIDPKGGCDVTLGGTTGNGQFRVTTGIRISKSNVGLIFNGGASLATDFTSISGGSCAVLIFGTAEAWLPTGTISSTTKYNRLINCKISRTGGSSPIGLLSTGTRNMHIESFHAEQLFAGVYLENTSELTGVQVSAIGCYYGLVGDARKNRTADQSPLGIANVDNDCSSCSILMMKAYYPQHSGLLLINSGTMDFFGGTIGRFSENPSAPGTARYGLPDDSAGVHYYGSNTNFTKGGILDGFVFEAQGANIEKTCIYLHSPGNSNPVRGVTIRSAHVQTYDENYTTGAVTNLLKVGAFGGGVIDRCSISDSGFTPQTTGFFYGRHIVTAVGSANFCIATKNLYPSVAMSMSTPGLSMLGDFRNIEETDLEALTGGVPSGWSLSAGTVSTAVGGASGVERSLQFSGNDGATAYMFKTFNYRKYLSKTNVFYISVIYKGTVAPHINFIVNGASDSARITKTGTNQGRYSNAFYDYPISNTFSRAVYAFNFFSANFSFDNIRVELGRGVGASADFTEYKSIEIGYGVLIDDVYNTF